jgi:integrase/recombinase XerD
MAELSTESATRNEQTLDRHLVRSIRELKGAGYSSKTLRDKERLIVPFVRWTLDNDVGPADLDEACVDRFLACPTRRRYRHGTALRQFIEHLRAAEIIPVRPAKPSPGVSLIQRYLAHLRNERGLSARSLTAYLPFVKSFADAHGLPENNHLDAVAMRSHLLKAAGARSVSSTKLCASALRSFLRFCFVDGTTTNDLSTAVPPIGRWQPVANRPVLSGADVEQVIAAAGQSTKRERRDFAILLLLARLGLRASEVLALEIDDIRWETGAFVVRGKGRYSDCLPILADVGEALSLYLRTARGSSVSRSVFLVLIAPCVGLSQPADVSKIAREAMKRAGLLPTGRAGAHVFRYRLAHMSSDIAWRHG